MTNKIPYLRLGNRKMPETNIIIPPILNIKFFNQWQMINVI